MIDLKIQEPLHFNRWMFVGLAIVIAVVYLPALNAFFISDDWAQLSFLSFFTRDLLNGQRWDQWFLGSADGYLYFRPLTYNFMLVDYLMWHLAPWGYHLTRLILHLFSSFLVFLISWQIARERRVAAAAAILFAVLPIHAEAVSWIAATTDVLCGFLYLSSFLFFILYRKRNLSRYYWACILLFVLALSAKEVAITLPLAFLAYDALLHWDEFFQSRALFKRHAPLWIILGLYLGYRFVGLGGFGYKGLQLTPQDIGKWIIGTLVSVVNPIPIDWTLAAPWVFGGALLLVLLLYRSRRAVIFGLVWIPISYLATLNALTGTSDRSFYVPSVGLCLALASILTQPLKHDSRLGRSAGLSALILLGVVYGYSLFLRNIAFDKAGAVAQAIADQVIARHPTMEPDARMVFVGVPDQVPEGPLVYMTGLPGPFHIFYGSRAIQVLKLDKFPILFDRLDHTYLFEVDHRHVTERTDLVQALQARAQCESNSTPFLTWTFSQSLLDWEPWNQLSEFAIRDGVLTAHSEGDDPIMASPPIDVPAIAVGEIQITMRARADQPVLRGELYWLASGQRDFLPGLKSAFQVLADGEWHTYHIDIAKSGMLLIGDRIMQIRLDPADAPAEIAIQSITVFTHCSSLQGEHCICAP